MRESLKSRRDRILKDYADVEVRKTEDKKSHIENGVVCLNKEDYKLDSMVSVFNLLHEIGHVYTNEPWMSRAEREWRATTWAIFHMKKYGIKIPEWRKKNFQEDIYFWYEVEKEFTDHEIRMSKTQLKLFWRD